MSGSLELGPSWDTDLASLGSWPERKYFGYGGGDILQPGETYTRTVFYGITTGTQGFYGVEGIGEEYGVERSRYWQTYITDTWRID